MTRTSATGRADAQRARSRAGFTLVELLMVVAIIGLAAGAVVLSMPDPRPSIGVEAERFAARLVRAREEALMTNRLVAVETDARGYGFVGLDGDEWTPLSGVFAPRPWGEGVTAPRAPMRVVFDPTGVTDPAEITLSRDGVSRTIRIDGAGEVTLDG